MNLVAVQAAEKKLLLQTYARYSLLFTGGKGVHLIDAEGNEYLDLLSGIGVSALGYAHPAIARTMVEQSTKLLHTSNLFYHEGTATLALKLTEMTGMDRVFFCNSGAESWEAALKLARAHAGLLRKEGREIGTRILAMEHSFHGRTMGAVATTHKKKYREPFAPVMPGVDFVPFNDVEALRSSFSSDICAICIEVVQGEGGIHVASQEFVAAARELCDSTGALLLIDDVFDSGRSLEAVVAELRRRCRRNLPEQIRVATVYYKPARNRSNLTPDFYVRSTDQWLVFPHEINGLTREEILANKPVDESFFTVRRD